VIYLYLDRASTVVFFYVYTKSEQENLSTEQLRRLRGAAGAIRSQYSQ
jgi:hypothetical protein